MGGPALQDNGGGSLKQKLIGEFSTVLDESLILAIVDERDVENEYAEIRLILNALADTARAEQATGFDPSGLGCWAETEGQASDEVETCGNGMSTENATTVSEYSDSDVPKFTHQPDLGEPEKIENLQLIFPNFKEHTIKFVLKQSGGDLERAFDHLLDRQYLEESGELPKGIDGFYAPDGAPQQGRGSAGRNRPKKGKAKLPVSYTVVSPVSNDAEIEGASGPSSVPTTSRLSPRSPTLQLASTSLPLSSANRSHMRSAASLNRLGPLGRQGAIVYIQRAREEARLSLAKTAGMAEMLVNSQSTSNKIDLHGVTVLDGVRIAKHRVWQWWENLGEARERTARQQGFTVVTGVGRHSANGVSRLRQAVGAALKNDGWRVETLTGQFYVTGRL
ncbi:hypothetical protein B0T16DRAFT_431143 [Cercophora newfieldiana]|uniref:Smr domain-containing protein n=1 Tax=Cercophora newfieldiana TaxID=92897 RepID=A0AA40CKY3_9PEZI|nr:hypothetical protein B0T16DRAFT_431143 [Cercophora newfieldiana]